MKLRYISAVATLAVLMPFAASALTADDLQQKIQSLLSQISQLQQQLKQLQTPDTMPRACTMEAKICPDGSSVGRSGPNCEFAACPGTNIVKPVPPIRGCPQIIRTLKRGARGEDVSSLQSFLGITPTGYFGSMTEAAVQSIQAEEGVASTGTAATTGYGMVGAKTRAALIRRCGGGGNSQNFFASPTWGQAPLAVKFSARGGKENLSIDFGDGSTGTMIVTGPMLGCPDTIQAGSSNPACGTYGLSATHTYTSNGTYTATLWYQSPMLTCPPGAMCPAVMPLTKKVGTVTIYVGGTNGGAPSISGLDAPTSLAVGQTGTWTVHASVANGANTNLRYSVVWGDESVISQLNAFAGGVPSAIQALGSFTHAYGSAGTYKPTFTVANDAGSAQTSASVSVGGDGIIPSPGIYSSAFSASPTSGSAPLAVRFSYSTPGSASDTGYTVSFGDGTSGAASRCAESYPLQCSTSHTYSAAGTYTASLIYDLCAGREGCLAPVQIVKSVTITVH